MALTNKKASGGSTKNTKASVSTSKKTVTKEAEARVGADPKLFKALMAQRHQEMVEARSAGSGLTPFPEEGTFYCELQEIASGVKNGEFWARPLFRVLTGDYEDQVFAGDGGNTGKRKNGLWILANGLTGGQAPEDPADLLECYEDCKGNLYQVDVKDNEGSDGRIFRNVRIVRQIEGVPDEE